MEPSGSSAPPPITYSIDKKVPTHQSSESSVETSYYGEQEYVVHDHPSEGAIQLVPPTIDEYSVDSDTMLEYYYPAKPPELTTKDEAALAAKDSLALEPSSTLDTLPMAAAASPRSADVGVDKGGCDDVDEYEAAMARQQRRKRGVASALCLVVIAIIVVLAVVLPDNNNNKDEVEPPLTEAFLEGTEDAETPIPQPQPTTQAPSMSPTHKSQTTEEYKILSGLVQNPDSLLDMTKPQGVAFQDLLNDGITNSFLIQQRYAMYVLFYATGGQKTGGGRNLQTAWKTSVGWQPGHSNHGDECQWFGVGGCRAVGDGIRAVAELTLASNNLIGSLPPELCLLERLEKLDVHGNNLSGEIPACLGSMETLQEIRLNTNGITGPLPTGLLSNESLLYLDFSDNQLTGDLATLFGEDNIFDTVSDRLFSLRLHDNMLTGSPPVKVMELYFRGLRELTLHNNMLSGSLEGIACFDDAAESWLTLTADCEELECSCCTQCYPYPE